MITFLHSGDIGDILFSLYVCNSYCNQILKENKFNFCLTFDSIKDDKHNNESILMLKDLLESQYYINECKITNKNEAINLFNNVIDLDLFRKIPLNWYAGFIAEYPTHIFNMHLDLKYWEPIIKFNEIDYSFKDKFILTYNNRYFNPLINYNILKPYSNNIIFMGIEKEHKLFEERFFKVEFYESDSFIDIAKKMLGCKYVIGTQGGLYSLAEVIKCNRMLLRCEYFIENGKIHPGPSNNIPIGGKCDLVITNQKLQSLIKELLNENSNIRI